MFLHDSDLSLGLGLIHSGVYFIYLWDWDSFTVECISFIFGTGTHSQWSVFHLSLGLGLTHSGVYFIYLWDWDSFTVACISLILVKISQIVCIRPYVSL